MNEERNTRGSKGAWKVPYLDPKRASKKKPMGPHWGLTGPLGPSGGPIMILGAPSGYLGDPVRALGGPIKAPSVASRGPRWDL
jgi:hypothetical protein